MTGHINYKGVNVMKNKKKTAGILLLTCILGAVLIFVPKYIFSAVKTSMDTYSNKKEAMKAVARDRGITKRDVYQKLM